MASLSLPETQCNSSWLNIEESATISESFGNKSGLPFVCALQNEFLKRRCELKLGRLLPDPLQPFPHWSHGLVRLLFLRWENELDEAHWRVPPVGLHMSGRGQRGETSTCCRCCRRLRAPLTGARPPPQSTDSLQNKHTPQPQASVKLTPS